MKHAGTGEIVTPRLILRRYTVRDARQMNENWATDPEVNRFMTWPIHKNIEETISILADWESRYTEEDWYNWAIQERDTGDVIGSISVVGIDERVRMMEIGYCLSRSRWGRGIMPEALRGVVEYLFEHTDVNRIQAKHDTDNPKSGRVMEKTGMRAEGVLRDFMINNQGIRDMKIYSILRREWNA